MKKLRVILVDDHEIVREGIKSLIEDFAVVIAEASNGREFLDLLKTLKPDLVLMDIVMPEMDGIEAARIAIKKYPDLKIIVLSSMGDTENYHKMVESGVRGFVIKTSGISEIETAIKEVSAGRSYFSNEILQKIISNITFEKKAAEEKRNFSKRETEVLKLICDGLSTDEIAEKLFISPETVKGHRSKLLEKSGCSNTAKLVIFAIKNKLVEM